MKNYEKIGDHTIKKFELVSEYAKGWAHKILGYSESAGLIYIDCMCNCGKYYDNDGNIVEGTAIRVVRTINQINSVHQKQAILYFNDLDNDKILHLKSVMLSSLPPCKRIYILERVSQKDQGNIILIDKVAMAYLKNGEKRMQCNI